jgi:hypothetical protein
MIDETRHRRQGFQHGTPVRLADGQNWSLAPLPVPGADAEFDAMIRARIESEDQNDALRCVLATTILLLARNYELSPGHFQEILDFGSNTEACATAQRAVHTLLVDSVRGKEPGVCELAVPYCCNVNTGAGNRIHTGVPNQRISSLARLPSACDAVGNAENSGLRVGPAARE